MTTCVILQPSYVPWPGTFQLIRQADVYVHLDDVQFDRRGWRQRNRLKGPNGPFWITIPISLPHGSHGTLINDVLVTGNEWHHAHLSSLSHAYAKAPHIDWLMEWFSAALESRHHTTLADITAPILETCADLLGLETRFVRSSTLVSRSDRTMRLVDICQQVGADHYLSGPSARSYIDLMLFHEHDINVEFIHYRPFTYPQLHGEFVPQVSILDAFAMLGFDAGRILH